MRLRQSMPFIMFILCSLLSQAQEYNDGQRTDTFRLKNVEYKKAIAYKVNSVTIMVNYNDFMKVFVPIWKRFKEVVKSLDKGKAENTDYRPRFHFLDTTYQNILRQINERDTAYLEEFAFKMADMGSGYYFDRAIESGNCIIFDKNHKRHYIILRQKFSYQKDKLDGRGGRLYFIPGDKKPFTGATDWVS